MKRVLKYFFVPTAVLFLTGCAGNISSPASEGENMYEKKNNTSYIIFLGTRSTSRLLIGGPISMAVAENMSRTIMEFDPKTYETKFVGKLMKGIRLAYKTTPGIHYFYMDGGGDDDMVKITTKSATEYYVQIVPKLGISPMGTYDFRPLSYPNIIKAESLKGQTCSSAILNQYGFKAAKDTIFESRKITGNYKYHSVKDNINIQCRGGMISDANHLGISLEDIKDSRLIQPNEKAKADYDQNLAEYAKEIKEYYPVWKKDTLSKTTLCQEDGKSIK